MKTQLIAITLCGLLFFAGPARAATHLSSGDRFRAAFDFSAETHPPVDISIRFIDVVMTPQSALETWTVSLYDDPATKIVPDLTQNADVTVGPFTIVMGFSLNSPCCSGLPQEVADQRGFFETTVSGGTLDFANAVAVYHYHDQPGAPEINQEIFFTAVVPEPDTVVVLLLLVCAGVAAIRPRRLSAG